MNNTKLLLISTLLLAAQAQAQTETNQIHKQDSHPRENVATADGVVDPGVKPPRACTFLASIAPVVFAGRCN